MSASLPMYDLPELVQATDTWWRGLAAAMRRRGVPNVSERLQRARDLRRDPRLLVTQVCGYEVVTQLAGLVKLVATPRYTAYGCQGAGYTSWIVVPPRSGARDIEALRGGVCAVNQLESHSGCNALRGIVAPLAKGGRFFSRVLWTGAHRRSLELVARGEADVAAIDCVTYALLQSVAPALTLAVRIIGQSEPVPGLPLVTALGTPTDVLDAMREALHEAAEEPALRQARTALMLDGFEVLPLSAYAPIAAQREAARDYLELS